MRFIILSIFFIFSTNLINAKIYLISANSEYCQKFIQGVKSSGIKFCNKIDTANYLLTCGNVNYSINNIPTFATLVDFCSNNKNIKIILKRFPSLKKQMNIINKITGRKNRFGIVLSSKNKIQCLQSQKIKNLKIFYINKNYEIPYKIDQAVKSCDIIFLYPDKIFKNKLILEFIIKKIILSGKFYIAYSKKFLDLGAKIVFIPDYFKEGKNFAMIIKNRNFSKKILEPKFFKIKVNNYNK